MTNDCVSITKILVKGIKLMTDRRKKNTHIKSKGHANKNKCHKKNHMFSCTKMIGKHPT